MKKKLAILGSTGSIGKQTLEVIGEFPESYQVEILSAHSNFNDIMEQIVKWQPSYVIITDPSCYQRLVAESIAGTRIVDSFAHLTGILEDSRVDLCVGGISGAAGISPTLSFLEKGITVALANKETLVSAGGLVRRVMEKSQASIITVDSEHSAIMQCMEESSAAKKILLTASGGPFRTWEKEALSKVRVEDALQHPTWNMGKKITIDSATLMNKGLEVIEANWLFQIPYEDIQVIIHPESIVHSLVEYGDGSILGHLGPKDMRIPIQYALTWPDRRNNSFPKIDLTDIAALTFYKPDLEKFPCLSLAYAAGKAGGSMPTVLNGANEMAVALFLDKKIGFMEIPLLVEKAMEQHKPVPALELDEILHVDAWARKITRSLAERV